MDLQDEADRELEPGALTLLLCCRASEVLLDFLDFRGSGAVLEAEDRRYAMCRTSERSTAEDH